MPYKDRETQLAAQRENKRKRRDRLRRELLAGKMCVDCGNTDPRVLEFHHRDPSTKEGQVLSMLSLSMRRILQEVAKCDILCANCHRIRHALGMWV